MAPIRRCRTCVICKKRYSRVNESKRKFMTKFPIDEDRCRQWVQIIGNEDLAYIPIEKLHEMKYVCGDHFRSKDFNNKKSRLKKWAIPSLLINMPPLSDHLLAEFPCHIAKSKHEIAPSCSAIQISTSEVDVIQHDHNYLQFHSESQHCLAPSSYAMEISGPSSSVVEISAPLGSADKISAHSGSSMAPPCSAVQISTSEVDVIKHDHNYLQFPSESQHCLAPSSYAMEISGPSSSVVEISAPSGSSMAPLSYAMEISAPSSSVVEISASSGSADKISAPSGSSIAPLSYAMEISAPSSSVVEISASSGSADKISAPSGSSIDITPRKKKLLKKLQTCKIKLKTLRKKIHVIDSIDSPVLKTLITSTLKNKNRKLQARRWSNSDKGLALAIYKKSPKAYRFLRHMIPLPSIRTLQTVLQKFTLEPGVNEVVLTHLRKAAQNFKEEDKICVIMFDEMALKKRLILNTAKDKIEGYEDLGEEGRTDKVANHALVFMMQGLRKKYKQPLAHYFVQGTISTSKLSVLLKDIIRKVTAQGFTVIATVCDQGPTNMGALNLLKRFSGNNAESNYFLLDDRKIYTLYDVPHLFKSIRNNFLQAGEIQWENKKAKWLHLIKLEEKNKKTLHFTKITKRAVEPKYKGKMKVKLAAQILSNTVAAVLKLLAECSVEPDKKELLESAEIIEDLDKLFDVTNGPASYKDIKKNSRENVKKNSFHHEKWKVFKNKLRTLKFIKNGKPLQNVRCVKGFLITISSLEDIWRYLESRGLKYMNLRQLNQDSLENLFGLIRQHSPTNRNPTCQHFTSALKSTILTRMSTPVSRGGNCEQDSNNIMFDFHEIVFGSTEGSAQDVPAPNVYALDTSAPDDSARNSSAPEGFIPDFVVPDRPALEDPDEDDFPPLFNIPDTDEQEEDLINFDNQPVVYVSGYLAKKMLAGVTCNRCRDVLQAEDKSDQIYKYISLKEWDANTRLTYPSIALCNEVNSLTKIFEELVKGMLHVTGIIQYSQTIMLGHLNTRWMCKDHFPVFSQKLVHLFSILLIRNECRKINESFSILEDSCDDILKKAQQGGTAK